MQLARILSIIIVALSLGLMAVQGCAGRNTVPAMKATYVATFDLLTDANIAGMISDREYKELVVPAHRASRAAILAAEKAEKTGDQTALAAARAAFDEALRQVQTLRAKASVPSTQRAGLDLLAILALINVILSTAERLSNIASKMGRGEILTPEEEAFIQSEYDRVDQRVEQRAKAIG